MKTGDLVWLLPDADKREVPFRCPAVVEYITDGGRIRVRYLHFHSVLVKTVITARIETGRAEPCKRIDPKSATLETALPC